MIFNRGDFVTWKGKDEQGSFTHKGRILSHNSKRVEIITEFGTFNIPATDGKITKAARVKGLFLPVEKQTVKKTTILKKDKKKESVEDKRSNYVIVSDVVMSYIDKGINPNRQQIIEILVNEHEMKPGTASSTYAKVKKDLKLI